MTIKKYLLKHTQRRRRGVEHIQMMAMTGKYTEKQIEEKIKESMKKEMGY